MQVTFIGENGSEQYGLSSDGYPLSPNQLFVTGATSNYYLFVFCCPEGPGTTLPHLLSCGESDPPHGANGLGTLFQITTSGIFGKLFDFTGTAGAVPGASPYATLMEHTNGSFYGATLNDGAFTDGDLYELTPPKPIPNLIMAGPFFVLPGAPVEILGNNLSRIFIPAQFQPGSDTYLIALVPSAAVDGSIIVVMDTGLEIQSQMAVHILPLITNSDPTSGAPGTQVGIVGGGFARATKVTFGGVKATSFTVVSPTLIQAIVPAGAKTGKVGVVTHNGTATSKQKFTVN